MKINFKVEIKINNNYVKQDNGNNIKYSKVLVIIEKIVCIKELNMAVVML